MSFWTGTQAELLYSLNAPITKNTWTTEAAFTGVAGTNTVCALPGGYFLNSNPDPVGRSLYLIVEGTIGQTASPTFAVNLGHDTTAGTKANSLGVMAATAPPLVGTAGFHFEVWYTCTAFATTTMTLQVNGKLDIDAIASGGVGSAAGLRACLSGSLTGLVPSTAYFIEMFGTWSASNAANQTVVQQMLLFGLN